MKLAMSGVVAAVIVGCTTGDKATPADTATGQSTTVAPANASTPVLSAPVDSVPMAAPVNPTGSAKPRSSTQPRVSTPKASTPRSTAEPMMHDSAFKPRATVDEQGNIHPIKRDTLR